MTEVSYSVTVAAVLDVFLDAPREPRYGLQILRQLGLGSGTVYPILKRLVNAGWLDQKVEEANTAHPGRVPRCWYTLTPSGERHAKSFTGDVRNLRPTRHRTTTIKLHPTEQWYAPGSTVAVLEYEGNHRWFATEETVERVTKAQIFTTAGRFWRRNLLRVGRCSTVFRLVPRDNKHAVDALGPPTPAAVPAAVPAEPAAVPTAS